MERLDKRPSVAEDAAEAIRRYIAEQRLQPGDPLPSERQIQQQLQISRSSVREALRLLEMMGFVQARHGKGIFVSGATLRPMVEAFVQSFDLLDEDSFVHLLDVRDALELGIADLAAKLRTDDDLAKLEEVLAEAKSQAETGASGLQEDLRFHELLVHATHNPLLDRLYSCIAPFLVEVRQRSLNRSSARETAAAESNWRVAAAQHTAIYEAVRDQDRARAVRLMHEHLVSVRAQLRAGLPASSPDSPNGK